MKNIEILKKIFWDYIKNTWKTKFVFTIFLWLIVSCISVLEPFIFVELIKKIEFFLTSWSFNKGDFF